jgi:hypothetical protein
MTWAFETFGVALGIAHTFTWKSVLFKRVERKKIDYGRCCQYYKFQNLRSSFSWLGSYLENQKNVSGTEKQEDFQPIKETTFSCKQFIAGWVDDNVYSIYFLTETTRVFRKATVNTFSFRVAL